MAVSYFDAASLRVRFNPGAQGRWLRRRSAHCLGADRQRPELESDDLVQNLVWATGYNAFAIPLAAGVLYGYGVLLSPAMGAVLMSLSTVIVAINARFLKIANHTKLNAA